MHPDELEETECPHVGFSSEKNEIYVITDQHKDILNERAKNLVNSLKKTLHRDLLFRRVVNLWMLLKEI